VKPKEDTDDHAANELTDRDSLDISPWLVNATQLPQQISPQQIKQISPSALAYLGDAIYELYVRMFYLWPQQRLENYHRSVVDQVRAETQAIHLRLLTPYLRSNELEIVRRGRNSATSRHKRLNPEIYQQATSLETLVGYLYLTDYPRLTELLQKLPLEK
jgi:ribonuclease-3 family protein